jgi:hypothetical protein
MFVNQTSSSDYRHKNGLCIAQRRGGKETLVQWQNGDQRWLHTTDLDGKIVLIDPTFGEGDDG